jgi:hypothetical protein
VYGSYFTRVGLLGFVCAVVLVHHADAADTNRKCIQVDYLIFMRNLEVYIIYSIKAYLSILEYYLRSEKNATMSYVPRKVVHV